MRTLLCVLAAVTVAGCATQAERTAEMQREVDDMIAVQGPACERLGYTADSPGWRDCVLRLNAQHTRYAYRTLPSTTSCFGHRGFFQCSTF